MARRIVYGVGPVRELLGGRARAVAVMYVSKTRKQRRPGDPVAGLVREARGRGVAVDMRDLAELDALAGTRKHQGVVCVVGAYPYAALDDVIARAGSAAVLVALDSVQDPHNLGAIVRSAYVLGAAGVIIPRDRAAEVTAVVTKVSAGATEHMPIVQVTNLVRALDAVKRAGFWLAALAAEPDARPLHELDGSAPLCLILGAEGRGVRPLVRRACDLACAIPMAGAGVGSLNVSVAAGIALYEVMRQRQSSQ